MDRYQIEITPKVLPDPDVAFSGHYGLIKNYIKHLRGCEEMLVKREVVLNVVRAIEMLYQSAAEGCEVRSDP